MDIYSLGTKPITEDNPAGDDIRQGQEFESLHAEIGKLSIIGSDSHPIDWERVRDLSISILTHQSKDLFVATYLAGALTELNGLQGLADGTGLLRDLTANFWENMHPPKKRMRGRMNAFAWWKERAVSYLKNFAPDSPQDQNLLHTLSSALSDLDADLGQKSNDAPTLRDIRDLVQRIPVRESPLDDSASASEPSGPAVTEPEQPTPKEEPSPQAKAPPGPARSEPYFDQSPMGTQNLDAQEAEKIFKHGLDQLFTYRDWLLAQDPVSPLAFRIIRWVAWSRIQTLPPTEGSATHIPPPEPEVMHSIQLLLSQAKFRQVLQESESRINQYLFWLDLTWASAQALQGLGEDGAGALDVLETETALFLRRLPGLQDLAFNDGTPFCRQQTRDWLQSLANRPNQQSNDAQDPAQEALALARTKSAQNDILGALGCLETALEGEGRMRERYRLQVSLLQLLAQFGPEKVGPAYAQEIVATLDRFGLDTWDPDLALLGLEAAYTALRGSTDQGDKDQARALFARMGRIRPARALAWTDLAEKD